MSLCVVKLGGSLGGSPQRDGWLDAIAAAPGGFVIVPGGGVRARRVRAEQIEQGFDDAAAHARALLAMQANGAEIARRNPRFAAAASPRAIAAALAANRIPVWLPATMALAAPDIPASWEMTSDSLAAWLAGALRAARLLLVKSCDVAPPLSLRALAKQGLVDPLFPDFAARSGALVRIAGPAALPFARKLLHNGGVPAALAEPMRTA